MAKRKGFTLIELLVVVAIIALLVSILLPAIGRVRELAKRVQCSTQLRAIGTSIVLYQNQNRDSNPTVYQRTVPLTAMSFGLAGYGIDKPRWYNDGGVWDDKNGNDGWSKVSTTGGCLWLLVRETDLTSKIFQCPSASNAEPVDMADVPANQTHIGTEQDLIDFPTSDACSYSYNDPFFRLLDASSSPALVIAADKNWAYDNNSGDGSKNDMTGFPTTGPQKGDPAALSATYVEMDSDEWTDMDGDNLYHGNSKNHQTQMQNVLYVDCHVSKEDTPCVGLSQDNIYTYWSVSGAAGPNSIDLEDKMGGSWAGSNGTQMDFSGTGSDAHIEDSYLGF